MTGTPADSEAVFLKCVILSPCPAKRQERGMWGAETTGRGQRGTPATGEAGRLVSPGPVTTKGAAA